MSPERPLKYQCPLCKELTELRRFATSSQGLRIWCVECKAELLLPPTVSSPENSLDTFLPAPSSPFLADAAEEDTKEALQEGSEKRASGGSREEKKEPPPEEEHEGSAESTKEAKKDREEPWGKAPPKEREEPLSKEVPTSSQRCPKCGTENKASEEHCRRCGLLFANVGVTFVPEERPPVQLPEEETAMEFWEETLARWEDEERHEKFLQYCSLNELFDFAAHCYSLEKNKRGKDPIAEKQLERIIYLVQQQLLAEQTDKKDFSLQKRRWNTILLLFLLVFLVLLLYLLFQRWGAQSPSNLLNL